ncbi:MAG: MerR family transcriptional regulator [Actinomycetota bacterium]|nr:MerR family transcriptional regulator [Actinomycetota bacterium]
MCTPCTPISSAKATPGSRSASGARGGRRRGYQAQGLLPAAERSTAGYRLYTDRDVELLTFIRRARSLGLHLGDISEVLDIRHGRQRADDCTDDNPVTACAIIEVSYRP